MASGTSELDNEQLFDGVLALIKSYIIKYRERSTKVIDFKTPAELRELIDFTVGDDGVDTKEVLSLCDKVLSLSVHTAHPRFYNVLFADADEVGLLGAFLCATANTNLCTYEIAPVYALMEEQVLLQIRQLVGWDEGDGIFSPGGSLSNLYGLLLARFKRFPECKEKGICGLPKMGLFCSEQSHYSVSKSAIVLGIGMENVVKVKCDQSGRMITHELDAELTQAAARGIVPVAVIATAGTTVLGAIDPMEQVALVCEKHKVWLHVDAAVGGALLFSRKHRHRLAGIERADSVSWNPHKSMNVTLQCSVFITKHKHLLLESNSVKAGYLFQSDKGYDASYDDLGRKSIQCGRLNDVFKLWLTWKQAGMVGMELKVDRYMEVTKYLTEKIKTRPRFHLLHEPDCTNVCFWYLPPCLQHLSLTERPIKESERLAKVAPAIKAQMVKKGNMMIAYQPLPGGVPNCLRMVLVRSTATTEDMDFVLDEVDRLGQDVIV